jgi:hypothetical protein
MKRLDSRRSAALLSGGGVSRSSGRSASHSLQGITIIQERCLAIRRWSLQVLKQISLTLPARNNNNSGALPCYQAVESPGPQACQPNTLCTEELQERCLAIRRWSLQALRQVSLTLPARKNSISGTLLSTLAMKSPGPWVWRPHTMYFHRITILQERCLTVWR